MDFDLNDNPCIICSPDHPHGIRAEFTNQEGLAVARVTLGEGWQGFTGMVQGGIITGLLDDAMWYAIYGTHQTTTVTAEITVRFIRPVLVGRPVEVRAHVVRYRSRLQEATGELMQEGEVCATASGKFMPKHAQQEP